MNLSRQYVSRTRMRGLTLIELMIAMLLGILVVGAAIGIFMTNRRTYTATESLGRVQENARTSFELISRDVREATGNACNSGSSMGIANVLNGFSTRWWSNWGNGTLGNPVLGFDGATAFGDSAFGTGAGQRIAGTEAIVVMSGDDGAAVVTAHDPAAAQFTVSNNTHGFQPGELLLICGQDASGTGTAPPAPGTIRQGAIFQMTGVAGSTVIGHAAGGTTPGNSTANLGLDGGKFTFGPNALITRLHATRWYIGANGRGAGRSLYQGTLAANGVINTQEVAEGVRNLSMTYLLAGGTSYVAAGTVTAAGAWNNVTAVRIVAALEGQENAGTDNNPLRRQLMTVATLRNRTL